MRFRVGFVQSNPKLLQPEKNLAACLEAMWGHSADLWVLPELATSGYVFKNRKEVASVAESVPDGPTCHRLRDFAKANDCAVVAGLPEKAGGKVYNASVLVTPTKTSLYRKVHLFWDEKRWFAPGDATFHVDSFKGVKIGMMVCFDWFFPESARTLALKGAQIIAHPSNLVLPWGPEAMRTRSLENRVFSVTANRIGTERGLKFIGSSQIVGTRGEILSRATDDGESVKVVEIDPSQASNKRLNPRNDLIKDRRPRLYSR